MACTSKIFARAAREPTLQKKELVNALSKVQLVLHNQDNREHDILYSDDYYQFHGGLSIAISQLSGKKPLVYFKIS